jgi:hypothetical protein
MPASKEFWSYFNSEAAPKLTLREGTLRKVFEFLDRKTRPLTIVETGCVRLKDNWQGDGQSTILFDKYVCCRDSESILYSVDIDQKAVALARTLVSDRVQLSQSDSVTFLSRLVEKFRKDSKIVDLVYLDSFDVDMTYWQPSAIHHLKELCAVVRAINKETMVVVDDCPLQSLFVSGPENQIKLLTPPQVGGKGRLIAEFAAACGAKSEFAEYQAAWTGF